MNNKYTGLIPNNHYMYLPWNKHDRKKKRIGQDFTTQSPPYIQLQLWPSEMFLSPVEPTTPGITGMKKLFREAKKIASVLLMPSPGEQFWLKIDCLDGLLNQVHADLSVQVSVLYSLCVNC